MHNVQRILIVATVGLFGQHPHVASGQEPFCGYFWFLSSCTDEGMRITFSGCDEGGHPEIAGFDIYRTPRGTCVPGTRVTDVPLPRALNQDFSFEVIDPDVTDGILYEYRVFGVNADRSVLVNPFVVYPEFGPSDRWYSGCGAAASHGTVVDWGWTVAIEPCAGTCLPGFYIETGSEELRPYVGQDVIVYGSFGWSIEGFGVHLESFSLAPCTVAVEGSTWSGIKAVYR